MAQLVDTSTFVAVERQRASLEALTTTMPGEAIALAAITASELLAGVYQADTPSRRLRREAFVEQILTTLPVIPFDLRTARVYARLGDELRRSGQPIGTHDLQIAATAIAGGFTVLTANLRDFGRVPGLVVRAVP
jgi:predicted nucleic acid-binding protein